MKKITLQDGVQIALATIMAASLALVAVGVRAGEVTDAQVRTVNYSDLKPNTRAGAAALYHRIHQAATAVCGEVDSHRLAEAPAVEACVQKAVFQSVSAVNSAKLTSEYNTHFGVVQQNINVASLR